MGKTHLRFPVSDNRSKRVVEGDGENLSENVSEVTTMNVSASSKTRIPISYEKVTLESINNLKKIDKISSESDIQFILEQIDSLLKCVPGPLTVQKLLRVDYDNYLQYYAENHYLKFLECLILKFDHSFPIKDGRIYKQVEEIFTIEDCYFFETNLKILLKNLKIQSNCTLLQILLNSEGMFACIFSHIFLESNLDDDLELDENWNEIIKLLISLPNRVSNVMKMDTPKYFDRKLYCSHLILNFIKLIEFLTDLLNMEPLNKKYVKYNNLALLLSKILINYNENLQSTSIQTFIKYILITTNQKSDKINLYRDLFWRLFNYLERPAIEILAKYLLINTNPNEFHIKHCLGKNLLENENWKFVFCTKIPLLQHFNDSNLLDNLIIYISSVSQFHLMKLYLKLTTIWSDRASLRRCSVEQHYYISKLIVIIANTYRNIGYTKDEREKIEEKIHSGIPLHIESTLESVRVMGLKTGEILLNILNDEMENKPDTNLKFDYNNLSQEAKDIVNKLDELSTFDLTPYYKDKDISYNLFDVINELMVKHVEEVEYVPPERQFIKKLKPIEAHNEIVNESIQSKGKMITIIDSKDFELDSDDDLEPYDLSNDIKLMKTPPPAYLRDLRDGLVETQDPEIFTIALQVCEQLIIKQLADDDSAIGKELLEILISLEPRFYVDNFDDLVFQSCVAITCTYPAIYAEYLCKEIHADIGTYSIARRILMMDILRQSAKNLSSFKPIENKNVEKKNRKLNEFEEIIKERLESKTKRYVRHKSFKLETINKFSNVAGYFFFPLLYGYNKNKMLYQTNQDDSECIFLVHFIETLAIIMNSVENCTIAPRMAKEALHFTWFLRFHKEVKVRMVVLMLIFVAVSNVPKSVIINDFLNELLEIRLWLGDVLSLNVARGEPNLECRNLAACTMSLIESLLKLDVE